MNIFTVLVGSDYLPPWNSLQDFSKEVDAKSSQKSSVLSTGNQLLRLKKVDTAALRAGLSQIDSQWTELLTQIPVVQEKLHQVQEKFIATIALLVREVNHWTENFRVG